MTEALPDYLARGLRIVICGTAVARASASTGHYYAGPGNQFWQFLWGSRIIGEPLSPLSDSQVLRFGVGLTDLAKSTSASSDRGLQGVDVPLFIEKMERYQPAWIAFHGKEAAEYAATTSASGDPFPWSCSRGRSLVDQSSSFPAPVPPIRTPPGSRASLPGRLGSQS